MPSAENGLLEIESGQTSFPMQALDDSGDHKEFESDASLFSGKSGYEPDVRPNGLVTGGAVSVASSGSNNVVDVAALTCYLAGVLETVAADTDVSITRAATDVSKICSITVNSSGAIAVVEGTDGSDSSLSETRAAAGGPPLIPVDSIEIAQVRMTGNTAAPIASSEIFSVPGLHLERYDYPLYQQVNQEGKVKFLSALPTIHTGNVSKKVYASYAEPIFAELPDSADFVPPDESYTVNSQQVYGRTIGSSSKSLGQGSFVAYGRDNVTDTVVKLKGENLWFRYYPDRNKLPHTLCQGTLGISRSNPAGDNISASCTISAETAALDKES